MKKIIVIVICIFCALPVMAVEIDKKDIFVPKLSDSMQKQCDDYEKLYNTANYIGYDEAYQKAMKMYNAKYNGTPSEIKLIKDFYSALAIYACDMDYRVSKNNKIADKAYRVSKKSVQDGTTQIYTIKMDILLASYKLEPNEMVRAYNLLMAINPKEANNFYQPYVESLVATRKYIEDRNQQRKDAVKYRARVMLQAIGEGAGNMATMSQQNAQMWTNSINTTPPQPIQPTYIPTNQRVDLYIH